MTSLTETILPLWVTVFALLFVFNFLYMRKVAVLYRYLREKQPKIWEELGRPTPFRNNPPSSQMKILAYLRSRSFEAAGDPELTRLCRGMQGMLTLSALGFLIVILGGLVMAGDMMGRRE